MTTRDIFVISDTHFGHSNIIKYCNRPFSSSDEMDELMVQNWNSVVKQNDIVYHLGDVYFSLSNINWQHRLNGRKRLILGNHDNGKDNVLHQMFEKIMIWRMFPEFGLLLTHVPVHPETIVEGKAKCSLNVHGHIHEKDAYSKQYVNVSVEKINYTPVSIETLRVK